MDDFYDSGFESQQGASDFDQLEEIEDEQMPRIQQDKMKHFTTMESEDNDSEIGQEVIVNNKAANPSRPINLVRMPSQFMSSSESDEDSNKVMPITTVRMSKDMPLSTVKEEQSGIYMSFSDRIQLVGSLAEK